MAVWIGEEIAKFVEQPPEIKINPNGVDIGASEVWKLSDDATAVLKGKERTIAPDKQKILPNEMGFYNLSRGMYEIRFANKVTIPKNAIGLCFPRTSLNRLGMLKSETGIWDSGYSGYGTQTMFVAIKNFKIHKDEFWFQFTLIDMKEDAKTLYEGHWQGERPEDQK